MTVKTALQLINQALDEYLSEQEADYDADTRFAITWFETHGMDTGPYGTAETLAIARGVAVAGVVDSGILEATREIYRPRLACFQPAFHGHLALFRVDPHDHAAGKLLRCLAHESGVTQSRSAQDDAAHAKLQRRAQRLESADAATELNRNAARRSGDCADRVDVARSARLCAVEVDDVQAPDGLRRELRSQRRRVLTVDRGLVVAPLGEPHTASRQQIDGRDQLEGTRFVPLQRHVATHAA